MTVMSDGTPLVVIQPLDLVRWIRSHLNICEREILRLKRVRFFDGSLDGAEDVVWWNARRGLLYDLSDFLTTGRDGGLGRKRKRALAGRIRSEDSKRSRTPPPLPRD